VIRHSTGTSRRYTAHWYLSVLGNILLWGIIAVDAWFLWPTSLGGSTTLVIVSGNSMEPTFHSGDLVIARSGPVEVGDIVVYRPTELGGAQIVHRLVGGDAVKGWDVKGDNNTWVDQWHPKAAEIVGPVEVHFNGAGRFANFLIEPWFWGFMLLGAVALVVWPDRAHPDDEEDGDARPATVNAGAPGRFP